MRLSYTPLTSSTPRPRHEPLLKIASGGMATVFLGALEGQLGFRQIVAIKRPHPHLLDQQGFRESWLREARLAAGIHHANVVDVRDVEVVGDAIQLVMDYVEGASLGDLVAARAAAGDGVPPGIALRIVVDACAGLHAAHELRDDDGRLLGLVHRDISPQNILVGVDGVARVTDFGIAKCAEGSDSPTSRETLKGKLGYMAPEYVRGQPVDRRADVFALGVVLWEALCGRRLFRGQTDGETLEHVLTSPVPPVSGVVPALAPLDHVVARAVDRDVGRRFHTAADFARALERAASSMSAPAGHPDVGAFVSAAVRDRLEERRRLLKEARRGAAAEVVERPGAVEAAIATEGRGRRRRRALPWLVGGSLAIAGAGAVALRSGWPTRGPASEPAPLVPETPAAAPPAAATSNTEPASLDAAGSPTPSTAALPASATSAGPPPAATSVPSAPYRRGRPAVRRQPPPNPYPAAP